MAARKLQTEIDRTLKKVAEGVELFESIYDKMSSSTNQTQKEKLELDLKSQIKKLQRLRDQIKSWVASNDIKDKTQLLDNRRLIETQMEKFKACEKEMKTKAFSKEGLIAAAKLDPKEREREEAIAWLQSTVEELQIQVESSEAEIESLQGSLKKRNKTATIAAGRVEELERLNERRKWHMSRLEIVLRLISNGTLSTDRVNELREDVNFFVESNTDEDFEEDDELYNDLNLDEEEEKFGLVADDDESGNDDGSDAESEDPVPPRTPMKKHDDDNTNHKREESPVLKKTGVTLQTRKQSISLAEAKPPPTPNFKDQPMASILKANVPPPRPPIRYAAAAAAAVGPPPISSTQTVTPQTILASAATTAPPTSIDTQDGPVAESSPSLTHPSAVSPMLSSAASASQNPDGSSYSEQDSPTSGARTSPPAGTPNTTDRKDSVTSLPSPGTTIKQLSVAPNGPVPPPAVASPIIQQAQNALATPLTGSPVTAGQVPQFPPGFKATPGEQTAPQPTQTPAPQAQRQPYPGLSDLVLSFENVKQKATMRMSNLDQVHKTLDNAAASKPDPRDTEKPKYYVPSNPFQTASYYPQSPLPLLSTTGIFSQLDVETLFYVFYYCPGTYQQYLAAKELRRQSWRFHVKYLTWFQRHSEPQAITDEYEQGVYVYFDWEGSWCQRKKSDFRFEYRYLSED